MSKFYQTIKQAVQSGKLQQPFNVQDVNTCCNNLLAKSPSFLSKHNLGNPGSNRAYFKRICRGCYEII